MRAHIESVGAYLPPRIVTSRDVEQRLGTGASAGWLEQVTGVRSRRVAEPGTTSSKLATFALRDALSRSARRVEDIDCLIVGSVTPDVSEPATANIIQEELGLRCAGFDLNNACNGFLSALHVADAFIAAGRYRCIAIACGEMLTPFIPWHLASVEADTLSHVGALTLGDAGGAVIVTPADGDVGVRAMRFMTDPTLWREATVLGGGSLYPHDFEKHWFMSRSRKLFEAAEKYVPELVDAVLDEAGWSRADVQLIIPHQVSVRMTEELVALFRDDRSLAISTYPELGNNAAASQPVALNEARKQGRLAPGTNVVFVACAAGFAAGVAAVRW